MGVVIEFDPAAGAAIEKCAAPAIVSGCKAILNLNDPVFKRFGVRPLHPRDATTFLDEQA